MKKQVNEVEKWVVSPKKKDAIIVVGQLGNTMESDLFYGGKLICESVRLEHIELIASAPQMKYALDEINKAISDTDDPFQKLIMSILDSLHTPPLPAGWEEV